MSGRAAIYRARWILPIDAPPIQHGEVEVEPSGRISRVGAAGPRHSAHRSGAHSAGNSQPPVFDLGEAILLPGLVDTHAHPELTGLRGNAEGLPFAAWIERIIRLRYQELRPTEVAAAVRWGLAEATRAGITTIAMTDHAGWGPQALVRSGLRGVCYLEVFGPDPAGAEAQAAALEERFAAAQRDIRTGVHAALRTGSDEAASNVTGAAEPPEPRARIGVSPHAPYTVSAELLELTLAFARRHGAPLSMHAAESEAECEFVRHGRGPLAERLAARAIAVRASGCSPIRWLLGRGAIGPDMLLAHCVQVSTAEVEELRRHGAAIAHCPVSNAKMGQGVAPLVDFVEAGIAVGLGSDSVASNNRLDMFAEARTGALLQAATRRDAQLFRPEDWVRILTLGGATALGLERETGSLTPGKWADLTAVSLGGPHMVPAPEPYSTLQFSATCADVCLTVVAGERLFTTGEGLVHPPAPRDRETLENAAARVRAHDT